MRHIFFLAALSIVIRNISLALSPNYLSFFQPVYDDGLYHTLENLYNQSQYRQKNPTALIPDHTVFRYAAGAYLRGVDPIYINSEHTPLGKYFIALSIFLFRNDATIILFFVLLTLFVIWLLGLTLLQNGAWAMLPLVLFSSEPLFLDQIRVAPMLDTIQLPFILFALYFFIREYKKKRFFITALMIGFVIATKTVVPGILLIFCFILFFLIKRLFKSMFIFFAYLPISFFVLLCSYIRTFLNGHTFREFLGFQKWIFLYQQSKLIYPFSVWRLLFLNQWQTWWGEQRLMQSTEWQVTWPIFTGLLFVSLALVVTRKIKSLPLYMLFVLWCTIYLSFLSFGIVSSRFLFPVLPIMYIVGIYTLRHITLSFLRRKNI